MKELIDKYEVQARTLLAVINDGTNDKVVIERAMACRRFVVGFLNDLKQF